MYHVGRPGLEDNIMKTFNATASTIGYIITVQAVDLVAAANKIKRMLPIGSEFSVWEVKNKS